MKPDDIAKVVNNKYILQIIFSAKVLILTNTTNSKTTGTRSISRSF